MRQGQQHRRGRGRNNNHNNNSSSSSSSSNGGNNNQQRKGQNPLSRSFESNGPDVKVRGTPAHVAEKYLQLARDAQSSGDPVLAENYLQHSEHYNRIIMTYREQQGLPNPTMDSSNGGQPRSRFDGPDTDDANDDMSTDDIGQSEQPALQRFPQEAQRQPELPRSQDAMRGDERPQRSQDHQQGQGRYRDRPERQNDRQNDRQADRNNDRPRHERSDRFERPDQRPEQRSDQRPERQEHRGERQDRPEHRSENRQESRPERSEHRPERSERFERSPDRNYERSNGERHAERPPVERMSDDRASEHQAPERQAPERQAPEQRAPEPRTEHPAEPREPRMLRERDTGDQPSAAVGEGAPIAPPRAEAAAPRRRERFGPGNEQPDFLRRPVRRPRREAEPVATPLPETPAGEPPRE